MNSFQKILILLLLFSGSELLNAQKLSTADKLFEDYKFSKAIPIYEKLLEKDPDNKEAWLKLGDCYRLTNQTDQAERCYAHIINEPDIPSITKLHYAQALLTNGNNSKAKMWFAEFYLDDPYDTRGKDFVDAITFREKLIADSNRFTIRKININSEDADFGAVPYKDGIIFSSSRPGKNDNNIDTWTGKNFTTIYYAKGINDSFAEPEIFEQNLQIKSNNGPVCFNPSGTEMYFTRNNIEGETSIDHSKTQKLKIFSVKIDNGKFSELFIFQTIELFAFFVKVSLIKFF